MKAEAITTSAARGSLEITWSGPYAWPGFGQENNLRPVPDMPGVYLMTFDYQAGYLVYAAGITCRSVLTRLKEHTHKYLNGEYNVLDVSAVQRGVRKEIWHGWGYARKHRQEFEARKREILDAVYKQLSAFRIFVADIGSGPRIPERLEAAIMNNLYQQPSPICDIPDRGMQLSARWQSEDPIIIKNKCTAVLHGLPSLLEI